MDPKDSDDGVLKHGSGTAAGRSEEGVGPFGSLPQRWRMRFTSWKIRHNALLTIAAAMCAPVLYLLFIDRYATNAFYDDDWSVVPLVHAALRGDLTWSQLWNQHHESRLLVGNSIDILFGFADRLDTRSLIFFSAAVLIASYAALLALVRQYLDQPLTPISVLVVGLVWFSLADIQNALWAFQISWYLTVFFFVMMLCALLLPNTRRALWLTVAMALAILSSLTTIQGFACWPVGAICILWTQPRPARLEIAAWLGTTALTIALYLPGYQFNEGNTCIARYACSPSALLHHPFTSLGFFFGLIGNVIPSGVVGQSPGDSARFVILGFVLFAATIFIVVQSSRYRLSREQLPLPLLLIVFSLLFDVTISVGRSGTGVVGAVEGDRFVMANLILFTGVVTYGLSRVYGKTRLPPLQVPVYVANAGRGYGSYLVLLALTVFLMTQVVATTGFGIENGQETELGRYADAEFAVAVDAYHPPNKEAICIKVLEFVLHFTVTTTQLRDASEDQLGEFRPPSYRAYRALGPGSMWPRVCEGETAAVR